MKVKKFNETYVDASDFENKNMKRSPKLSNEVNDFIQNLDGCVEWSIPDYVSFTAKSTNLKEFEHAQTEDEQTIIFAEDKKLEKLKEFVLIEKQITELEAKLYKLGEKKKVIYTEASSELMYKYQEELLDKDFNSFYKLFIEDDTNLEEIVHPDLWAKRKKDIELKIEAKKYNI